MRACRERVRQFRRSARADFPRSACPALAPPASRRRWTARTDEGDVRGEHKASRRSKRRGEGMGSNCTSRIPNPTARFCFDSTAACVTCWDSIERCDDHGHRADDRTALARRARDLRARHRDCAMRRSRRAVPTWPEWDARHLPACRLVGLHGDEVVGWAALSAVSSRQVYRGVAEVSVYIAESARGQGIGAALLDKLIAESERNGIWTLQAGILAENGPAFICTKKPDSA